MLILFARRQRHKNRRIWISYSSGCQGNNTTERRQTENIEQEESYVACRYFEFLSHTVASTIHDCKHYSGNSRNLGVLYQDCTHASANAECNRPTKLWLPQPQLIRDLNPDCRIDRDLGVRRIAFKMYCIHSLSAPNFVESGRECNEKC